MSRESSPKDTLAGPCHPRHLSQGNPPGCRFKAKRLYEREPRETYWLQDNKGSEFRVFQVVSTGRSQQVKLSATGEPSDSSELVCPAAKTRAAARPGTSPPTEQETKGPGTRPPQPERPRDRGPVPPRPKRLRDLAPVPLQNKRPRELPGVGCPAWVSREASLRISPPGTVWAGDARS